MRINQLLWVSIVASFFACGGTSEDPKASGGAAGSAGATTGGTAGSSGGLAGNGGASGSSGSAGASGASGTAGTAATGGSGGNGECDTILAQHKATLQKAKSCSLLGPSNCTVKVTLPPCGHWDFVDASHNTEIAELEALRTQFQTLQCPTGSCALGGYGPAMSTCKQSGQGGDSGLCQ
ncbi:MAG: hypothetical protein R3B13_41435 [Polyangiaceae bacterium]